MGFVQREQASTVSRPEARCAGRTPPSAAVSLGLLDHLVSPCRDSTLIAGWE